ncbi:unnamed protein product [Caenorhabditis brenneri]
MSHDQKVSYKFNEEGGNNLKPEFVYSLIEIRQLLANSCKLPYIFFPNEDDEVYGLTDENPKKHIVRNDCIFNELNKNINFTSDGTLTFRSNPSVDSLTDPIKCTYYKHSGLSEQPFEIEKDTPVKVPYYNFAFSCVRNGIVEFLKPFVNFAKIPKNFPGESIAVMFLPSINHKLFMKKMPKSKKFMKDNQFDFAQIMSKKEPRPLQDLLLQLGVTSEKNVFQIAKEHNFTTFFSGPQQIRDLIDVDFDTTDHRNFISQFLIDDRLCLKDGRKLVNDQLEKMSAFLTSTSDNKVFSALFLDEYGTPKSSIDSELSEMFVMLNYSKIFENTTLIVTSYDLSDKDVSHENDKYPLFAVRFSDKFMTAYKDKLYFLRMNFHRLLSSLHFNHMLNELINPNAEGLTSSPFVVQPTWRNCVSEGISEYSCICMNMNLSSEYPDKSEKDFIETLRARFTSEVKKRKCVKAFRIEDYNFFYDYSLNTSKEVRGVELTGFVDIKGLSGEKTMMLKKMFTFKKNFESFQSFDTARVIVGHEVNIGIASMCDL